MKVNYSSKPIGARKKRRKITPSNDDGTSGDSIHRTISLATLFLTIEKAAKVELNILLTLTDREMHLE